MAYLAVEDVVFHQQRFYAITDYGRLLVCDIGDGPHVSFVSDCLYDTKDYQIMNYLVDLVGELLMVTKYLHSFDDMPRYRTVGFHLYKFDFGNNKFKELKSLGEYSLFLGLNTSVSVLASNYLGLEVKKNCIYFTDDYSLGYMGGEILRGHDMGVFDLEDNSITPHFQGTSTSRYSPPVWIIRPHNDISLFTCVDHASFF